MTTVERIKEYIDFKKINIKRFEESVGFSNGAYASQLKNKRTIGVDKLENILNVYQDINPDWLLTGRGEMIRNAAVAVPVPEGRGIPLIPTEAFCGFGTMAFDDLVIEQYYSVEEFKQADFLIRVKGNSMYPKYSSGDVIACKMIHETLFFQWNKIYAIATKSQGVMVKRVNQSQKEEHILLVSDNEKYSPFDIPLSDIEALALVIGVIRVE